MPHKEGWADSPTYNLQRSLGVERRHGDRRARFSQNGASPLSPSRNPDGTLKGRIDPKEQEAREAKRKANMERYFACSREA
jgi:hypothetical protein